MKSIPVTGASVKNRREELVEVTGIEPVSEPEPNQDSYERRPDPFSYRRVTTGQVRGGQSP